MTLLAEGLQSTCPVPFGVLRLPFPQSSPFLRHLMVVREQSKERGNGRVEKKIFSLECPPPSHFQPFLLLIRQVFSSHPLIPASKHHPRLHQAPELLSHTVARKVGNSFPPTGFSHVMFVPWVATQNLKLSYLSSAADILTLFYK